MATATNIPEPPEKYIILLMNLVDGQPRHEGVPLREYVPRRRIVKADITRIARLLIRTGWLAGAQWAFNQDSDTALILPAADELEHDENEGTTP
jgi:hypothetical protein